MTATIQKTRYNYRVVYYVICSLLKNNLEFENYRDAKDFCEMKGWDVIRVQDRSPRARDLALGLYVQFKANSRKTNPIIEA